MDATMLKQNWKDLRAAVRARWPLLTDDDLVLIDGDADYLAASLEARYGWSADRADREVSHFVPAERGNGHTSGATFVDAARESLGPGARKVREGLDELGEGIRALAREQTQRARDAAASGADRVQDGAQHAAEATREKAAAAGEKLEDLLERVEQFVRERPFTSIGIAFAAGYLVFGRRR
jgi:ElaB/YqjD/DUF883 family membrane-anchored ribosome-binding protein/uncharacterized protein YjbJ (UPF0337 family)